MAADAEMARVPGVRTRRSNLSIWKDHKFFANTEGAFVEQTLVETGGGISATAVGNGEVQTRSYPNAFSRQQVTGGWEHLLSWDLPGNGQRVASEAVALLTADPCPSNITTTLILGGSQLALQVHESCGHPPSWTACTALKRLMRAPRSSPPRSWANFNMARQWST